MASPQTTTPIAVRWGPWLLANSLTVARFAAGLAFPFLPAAWRAPVAVAGGISDLVDGVLSRRLHAESTFGRYLDPIADKTFVLSVVGTLWYEGALPAWQIALVGLREWTVLAIALVMLLPRYRHGVAKLKPRWPGKLATFAQFVFVASLLVLGRSLPAILYPTVAARARAGGAFLIHAWGGKN
jgi:phosphatidylglycerophosphate synthase